MQKKRITQKDISLEAGVSVQAVSMALRGHKRISESTRKRVVKIAERLGYQADPAMSALADYRTRSRRASRKWECVALVSDWNTPEAWYEYSVYARLRSALYETAEERGFTIEEVWLGAYGTHARARFRELYTRGIHGLILVPPAPDTHPHPIHFPPKNFQVVTFGPEHMYPDCHTVQFDFYENLRLAWSHLRAKGFERPGLVYRSDFGWRTGEAWLGAYLAEKRLAGFKPTELQPCVLPSVDARAEFRTWLHRERPDALITILREVPDWLKEEDGQLPIALLSATEPDDHGIDIDPESAARAAMELLTLELQQQLVLNTSFPLRIHVPGKWV